MSSLDRAFAYLSTELNLDVQSVSGEVHDKAAAFKLILNAVTTRMYQQAQAGAEAQFPGAHVGILFSPTDVVVVISVSGRKHGLPVSAVMGHLMYTDATRNTLRPEFITCLNAPGTPVGLMLSLISEGNALDALLRGCVEDQTDTLNVMLRSNLEPDAAYAALLESRPTPAGQAGRWVITNSDDIPLPGTRPPLNG